MVYILVVRLLRKLWDSAFCRTLKQPKMIHNHVPHSLRAPELDLQLRVQHCLHIRKMLTGLMMEVTEGL